MGSYSISDIAAADLARLTDGMIERGASVESADRFVDSLLESFQNLADFPDMGTPRDYLPTADVLAFPHQNYMIFYRKAIKSIEIAQILYGGLDMAAYFDG